MITYRFTDLLSSTRSERLANQNGSVGIEHAGAFARLRYCQEMLFYIINITPPRLNPITQLLLQSRQTCTTFTSLPTRLRFNSFSLRLFQFFYILIYSSVTSCPLPRLNPVQLLLPPSVSILLPYLCSLQLLHPCRSTKAKFIYYFRNQGTPFIYFSVSSLQKWNLLRDLFPEEHDTISYCLNASDNDNSLYALIAEGCWWCW